MADDRTSTLRSGARLLCLGLILAYPLFSVPVQASIHYLTPRIGNVPSLVLSEGAIWLYGAVVLSIALFGERRSLASIGLHRPTPASLGFGIGAALVMLASGALAGYVVYHLLHQPEHAEAQAAAMVGTSVVYALCLAARAAFVEEIFFRGLAIEQLAVFTGRRWLAAVIATGVFVLVHLLHFDWPQLVPIATVSVVLAALYLWWRDLWANILAHFMVDAAGLVALAMQAHR